MTFGRACLLVMIAGCAHGGADTGGDGGTDATSVHHDAHPNVTPDSSLPKDASLAIDASIMIDAALAPDASTDGNLCADNNQCTDAGECCVTLGAPAGVCAAGVIIGSTCVPQ